MHKAQSLFNHLTLYRNIALITSVFLILSVGSGIGVMISHPEAGRLESHATYTAVISAISGLVVLIIGYTMLKNNFARAGQLTQTMFASLSKDSLTGALNRAYFLSRLKEVVYHKSPTKVGYIHLDMDGLKKLNDGSGHAVGDAALKALVASIRDILPNATIGRLGGDEFGIFITDCDNRNALLNVSQQILDHLNKPVFLKGRKAILSATMGIALAPADATCVDELISKADLALYEGKRAGRKMAVSYHKDMGSEERYQRFIERELRAAILMNQLELHYQPIFKADGITIATYEALVRWSHPVRGMIPPMDFIPIAEKSELIDKLGDWVLRRVCMDLESLNVPFININVSVAQLHRADFADRFAQIVKETGVDGSRLIVEVTETLPLEARSIEIANLEALRAHNIRIAIDDFGAGNASLSYLKNQAFDILKIDRSFITTFESNPMDFRMVKAICQLAQSANIIVVVEGVETESQFETLKAIGGLYYQGYLFGRPQSLNQIVRARLTAEKAQMQQIERDTVAA